MLHKFYSDNLEKIIEKLEIRNNRNNINQHIIELTIINEELLLKNAQNVHLLNDNVLLKQENINLLNKLRCEQQDHYYAIQKINELEKLLTTIKLQLKAKKIDIEVNQINKINLFDESTYNISLHMCNEEDGYVDIELF